MRKRLLFVCPVLLFAASAWGSTCSTAMLNTYIASGFSCTEGDLMFSNFSYVPGGLPTANSVEVTPVDDGTDFGFFFNGAFQSGAGMSSDAVLAYNISTVDKAPILAGDTVSLISYGATGGGNVQIVEGVCTSPASGTGACAGSFSVSASYNSGPPPSGTQSGSVTFPGTNSETVSKNIITNGAGGSAAISEFENTVQVPGGGGNTGGGPVPEPGSALTIGSGLIATSLLVRKKMRRSA